MKFKKGDKVKIVGRPRGVETSEYDHLIGKTGEVTDNAFYWNNTFYCVFVEEENHWWAKDKIKEV